MQAVAVIDLVHERNYPIEDDLRDAARWAEARVLITADCDDTVERLARRIHAASGPATSPFVHAAARTLSIDEAVFSKGWTDLFDAAGDGTLLITAVEHLAADAQDHLIERLASLQTPRKPARRVRLMTGTTTNLYDRVLEGTFSERLFYQLNIIHVMAGTGQPPASPADYHREDQLPKARSWRSH